MYSPAGWIITLLIYLFILPCYGDDTPAPVDRDSVSKEILTVGILDYSGDTPYTSAWQLTFKKLNQHPRFHFQPVFLTHSKIEARLQSDELDFVISNAIHYLLLKQKYGIERLLSRRLFFNNRYYSRAAITVYVRRQQPLIESIGSLKDKRIGLLQRHAQSNREFISLFLHDYGLEMKDLDLRYYAEPLDLLKAMEQQQLDAMLVKSGKLEKLLPEQVRQYRVLSPMHDWDIPFKHSSVLVPEWFFARSWYTEGSLANQVVALLIDQGTFPDLDGQYLWTVPENYSELTMLFPELQSLLSQSRKFAPLDEIFVHKEYWIAMTVSAVLLVFLVLLLIASWKLNKRIKQSKTRLEAEIYERHLAQEINLQHQEELAHVARLNTMGEMASGLAHELNQPLSAIYTYTQGCIRRIRLNNAEPKAILEALELAAQQANRASEIIRRLRNFVKKGKTHKTYSDINHIVTEVCKLLTSQIKNNNIQLDFMLEPQLPPVLVDIIQIEQVIINLLKNATETTTDGTDLQIIITTRKLPEHFVELCVIDNGHGINRDQLDRIYSPFYTTKPGGMGMGLSISCSIIESHDGKLYAHNNPDKGAKFCFTLPVADQEADKPDDE